MISKEDRDKILGEVWEMSWDKTLDDVTSLEAIYVDDLTKILDALTAEDKNPCPVCGEPLDKGAIVCPVCGEMFPYVRTAEDEQWVDSGLVLDENNAKLYYKEALTAEDVVFEDTLRGTGWLPKSQALTAEDEPKCIPVRGVNCKECSAYFMDLIKHHKEHHTAEDECPNCQGLRWYTLGEKDSQGRYTLEDED